MYGELIPTGGGDSIPLLKQRLLIGRRPTCDISLQYPSISSQHCEMEIQNGYWRIIDLGSSNGVKVNGERCEAKFLFPGDSVSFAKHQYEIAYEADPDAPPPEEDVFASSLMEKAGLVRKKRKKRPESSHVDDIIGDAAVTKIKAPLKPTGNKQEDEILQWLSED